MANAFSDYSTGGGAQPSGAGGVSEPNSDSTNYWSLMRLKRAYMDYIGSKRDEILEQQDARRYRHGSQWTDAQMKVMNKRKQPIVTYNHIGPKINGVIGLIEKLRQAPKAYPRTPQEEEGADLATACIRNVLDTSMWKAKSPIAAEDAAVDGLGGIALELITGDQGDPDVDFNVIDGDSFFYDPRSYKLDFSDCRYLGEGKWVDMDQAKEMFPDKSDDIEDSIETGSDLTTNADRENKWFISDGDIKRVRLIDHWYQMKGDWYWCIYTGSLKLAEGKSYFVDEKGKTVSKYIMFSANIDQDGDRYGFVRQFKSPQDEINQRRSKGLHLLNSRRIIAEDGSFDDIEKVRIEASRPDGVIIKNKGFEAEFDDTTRMQETEAQLKFLQEAKEELDSYGPTLSLIGEAGNNMSGRAISLQQQAGIAQLGPFILSYKNWKIRVYRAVWNAIKQYWKAERWIRVSDDDNAPQLVGINQVGVHPQTGMPTMVNHVSALDVDIIIDEGPDSINMLADTFDALNALAQNGAQVPADVLIELSPGIDSATRKRILDRLRQPDPMQEQAKQLELQTAQAKIADTMARAESTKATTAKTMQADIPVGQTQAGLNHANMVKALVEANQPVDGSQGQGAGDPAQDPVAQQEMANKQMEQLRANQEHAMKLKEAEMKMARDQEAHQAKLQETGMRLQMEQDKSNREALNQERDYKLRVAEHNKRIVEQRDATNVG